MTDIAAMLAASLAVALGLGMQAGLVMADRRLSSGLALVLGSTVVVLALVAWRTWATITAEVAP